MSRQKFVVTASLYAVLTTSFTQMAWPQSNTEPVKADTSWKAGDSYTYKRLDVYSKVDSGTGFKSEVSSVENGKVFLNGGHVVTDLYGNYEKSDEYKYKDQKLYPGDYFVGKEWTTVYSFEGASGSVYENTIHFVVKKIESITVPAGTFTAFKIEGYGTQRKIAGSGNSYPHFRQVTSNYWMAPEKLRRYIAREYISKTGGVGGYTSTAERVELTSYIQQ